jgi:hypothetical protein
MDALVEAFGPVFAAALAIQQLLEILDPIFDKVKAKKAVLAFISLAIGLALAFGAKLTILAPLGWEGQFFWDGLATGFVISGGTEGINSIMKFLGYKKDNENKDKPKPGEGGK